MGLYKYHRKLDTHDIDILLTKGNWKLVLCKLCSSILGLLLLYKHAHKRATYVRLETLCLQIPIETGGDSCRVQIGRGSGITT